MAGETIQVLMKDYRSELLIVFPPQMLPYLQIVSSVFCVYFHQFGEVALFLVRQWAG